MLRCHYVESSPSRCNKGGLRSTDIFYDELPSNVRLKARGMVSLYYDVADFANRFSISSWMAGSSEMRTETLSVLSVRGHEAQISSYELEYKWRDIT